MRKLQTLLTTVFACNLAGLVWAHPQAGMPHGHGVDGDFTTGLLHPVLGWDHLLAMIAIGLLAAQFESRLKWLIPTSFVGGLLLGGVVGLTGVELGLAEAGIAVSLISLGCALAVGKRIQTLAVVAAALAFGTVHGYAHGMELPATASPALYAVGFVLATILLHVAGFAVGTFAKRTAVGHASLRWTGAALAAVGIFLLATM